MFVCLELSNQKTTLTTHTHEGTMLTNNIANAATQKLILQGSCYLCKFIKKKQATNVIFFHILMFGLIYYHQISGFCSTYMLNFMKEINSMKQLTTTFQKIAHLKIQFYSFMLRLKQSSFWSPGNFPASLRFLFLNHFFQESFWQSFNTSVCPSELNELQKSENRFQWKWSRGYTLTWVSVSPQWGSCSVTFRNKCRKWRHLTFSFCAQL